MYLQRIISSIKSQFFFLSTLLLLLTFNASMAFADFYVIAGSRGVGTKITSLPATIASSGFYFIDKNLSCVAGSHGITITADNVTLDLMGFSLNGPGGSGSGFGIYINGKTNVEIRNGTVNNFQGYGISEISTFGTGHRIINVRVKDNGLPGITLAGKNHLVEKCTVASNAAGISVGPGSTVVHNTCYNNTNRGVYADAGCTVTGNTCYDNGTDGINAGNGTTVTGNTCRSNGGIGIYLVGNNCVDQNTSTDNATNMSSCASCQFGNNIPK